MKSWCLPFRHLRGKLANGSEALLEQWMLEGPGWRCFHLWRTHCQMAAAAGTTGRWWSQGRQGQQCSLVGVSPKWKEEKWQLFKIRIRRHYSHLNRCPSLTAQILLCSFITKWIWYESRCLLDTATITVHSKVFTLASSLTSRRQVIETRHKN